MFYWRIVNIVIGYLQGIYKSSGYDTTLFNDNNFPKVYFYGKYKYVGKVKNKNNKLLGCIAAELSLVRPWESISWMNFAYRYYLIKYMWCKEIL